MVETLILRFEDAKRAVGALKEILDMSFSVIVRDAAIQRFEFTFEACWKFIKEYLKDREGIICSSPKGCFRELLSLGILKEEETIRCLEMTDDRNMTAQTYKEEVSQLIFGKLPEYYQLLAHLLSETTPN